MSKVKFTVLAVAGALLISGGVNSAHAGDAAKGKKLFNKCKACHTVKEGGKNKLGPNLFGIVGKAAATVEGFKYSDALKSSGITWDAASLKTWVAKPKKMVKGTKMIFPGLKKESQQDDLVAYLETLK